MNKMKNLLLCSAAGLLAVGGAQAADMPMAEPVEYVRICETYGVGYWYIPGTDTCLKIGGYVRFELNGHESNAAEKRWGGNPFVLTDDPDFTGGDGVPDGVGDQQFDTFNFRSRGLLNFDARTETSYGTLRSFIQIRGTADDVDGPSFQMDLGFLQFAGFTAGLAPSFLDFATNGFFGDQVGDYNHDTVLLGYTYQAGGGVSLNVAIESADRADTGAVNLLDEAGDEVAFYSDSATRTELPDLTAALRVNQGWGEAMVGGAVREVKGRAVDIDDDLEETFHEVGWAVAGGLKINLPMIAKGDNFIFRASYGEGASRYVVNAFDLNLASGLRVGRGSAVPEATFFGGVDPDSEAELATNEALSVYGGFTHNWTDTIRSNFVASYATGDFNFEDSEWSAITASANIVWSPVKNLNVGIEVLYSTRDFDAGAAEVFTGTPDQEGDEDGFGAIFRIQRDFGS